MTDLTKGIIEINGFTIKPGTTLKEMQEFFGNNIRLVELSTGPRLKFLERYYIAENIYAYNFNFNNKGVLTRFSLIPSPPNELKGDPVAQSKYMLSVSKKWLKNVIQVQATTDCDEGISYHFDSFHISAFVRQDIHYGLVGGEIDLRFDNEV